MVKMTLPKASLSAHKKPINTTKISIDPILSKITLLASQLPPNSPSNSNLNPLQDLINLFNSIKLNLPSTTTSKLLELNRQSIHTGLHSIKTIFETLISQGRLHGILKSAKKVKLNSGKEVIKESEGVAAVRIWLNQRWEEYITRVVEVSTAHWDAGVRVSRFVDYLNIL